MGVYVAFAVMVGVVFLGRWMTRGWLRRFGARWWNGLLAGTVSFVLFIMSYNAFMGLGGNYWLAKVAGLYLLYELVDAYRQIRQEKSGVPIVTKI